MAEAGSMQHDLQERLRRCRGKQGQIFSSSGRFSPGLKGNSPLQKSACLCQVCNNLCVVQQHCDLVWRRVTTPQATFSFPKDSKTRVVTRKDKESTRCVQAQNKCSCNINDIFMSWQVLQHQAGNNGQHLCRHLHCLETFVHTPM